MSEIQMEVEVPRGGKRENAGRKPLVLSDDEELWIFGQCQRLYNLLTARKQSRQLHKYWQSFDRPKQHLYMDQVRETHSDMAGWSVEQRRRSQDEVSEAQDEESEVQEYELFLDAQANSVAIGQENARRKGYEKIGTDDPEYPDNRMHSIRVSRLFGGRRQQIIDLVSRRATKRFGKQISERQVRKIWESFNKYIAPATV
jgi:hypothetical protein